MDIELKANIRPFSVPNYVIIKEIGLIDGDHSDFTVPLNKMSLEVLNKMCEDYKETVLVKAGYPKLTRHAMKRS